MTNKSWFALGIGKKNKKGEYLDMYFHPNHISSSETKLEKSSKYELVKVSDDLPPSSPNIWPVIQELCSRSLSKTTFNFAKINKTKPNKFRGNFWNSS